MTNGLRWTDEEVRAYLLGSTTVECRGASPPTRLCPTRLPPACLLLIRKDFFAVSG